MIEQGVADGAPGTKRSNWDAPCLVAIGDKRASSRPQQARFIVHVRDHSKNIAVDGNPRISARRVQPGAASARPTTTVIVRRQEWNVSIAVSL